MIGTQRDQRKDEELSSQTANEEETWRGANEEKNKIGAFRELNSGPLTPKSLFILFK
jgi:hypothetical protein